jgi:1-acyl-sn-glycerol-3-phosphate acyltransferase
MLRLLFYLLLVKPFLLIIVGVNVRGRRRLPHRGPALIVANHNSHLDALVLVTILPLKLWAQVRPAASADYFLHGSWRSWFATQVIGIIPVQAGSGRSHAEVLAEVQAVLAAGQVVIFFPEGTRGEPESFGKLKTGILWLAEQLPLVPIYPVRLQGLGKVLPKGDWLPVPFLCDAWVSQPLYWNGDREQFMSTLAANLSGN